MSFGTAIVKLQISYNYGLWRWIRDLIFLAGDQERILQTIQDSHNTLYRQVVHYLKQEIEFLRTSSDKNLEMAIKLIFKSFGTEQVAHDKAVKRLEKLITYNQSTTDQC